MKKIVLLLSLLSPLVLWSQTNPGLQPLDAGQPQEQAPSLLAQTDSLFVEVVRQQCYLLHPLQQGQTLYSIKQFYGIELSDLYYFNNNLEYYGPRPGMRLKIPTAVEIFVRDHHQSWPRENFVPLYYRVKPGETLYSIAKEHFRMPVASIKLYNRLSSEALRVGQILLVGWFSREGVSEAQKHLTGLTGALAKVNSRLRMQYQAALKKAGAKEREQEGIAFWQRSSDVGPTSNLYVMHREAKVGSIIRIENPMTRRILHAKVIGGIPVNSDTNDAVVVLSATVARALGGLDSKFFVRVHYLTP